MTAPVETTSHIAGLNSGLPAGATDQVLIVDNHLQKIKEVLLRDLGGFAGSVVVFGESTHSSNVYPIALTTSPVTYEKGMILVMKALNANTAAVDVNIASLGAKNLKWRDGSEFVSGDIPANAIVIAVYNGSDFIAVSNIISASETYADTVAAAAQAAAIAASIPLIDPFVENNAVLQDDAGGVKDAGVPLASINEFLSGQLSISQGGGITLVHGLGTAMPSQVVAWLECVTTDSATGHTAGQFVLYKSGGAFNNQNTDPAPSGVQVTFDATYVYVRFADKNEILSLLTFGGGAEAAITAATASKWKLHVNAYKFAVVTPP
jgi:hypothetical protein